MCVSIMSGGWITVALFVSSLYFSEAQPPTAKFSNTLVQGIVTRTWKRRAVDSFMGIPYAEPPVGDLRFRDPMPKVYPDETLLANKPPIRCLQSVAKKMGDGDSERVIKGDEDCLYLNVHRPTSAGNQSLAVMVYFQAADLVPGLGDISQIGPYYLLDQDIVLVTLTYRLEVIGFLTTGDEAAPGNFGLKDQKLALEWIHSNIANFGGNPQQVTLFGHGGAAKDIHLHALVSHTAGLFNQYILQSGTAFAPWAVRDSKNDTEWTRKLAALNGCPTDSSSAIVDCLRMIDSRQLVESSYQQFNRREISLSRLWGPTKEAISPNAFLTECPEDLSARGEQRDMSFIAGVVDWELPYSIDVDSFDDDFYAIIVNDTLEAVRMSGSSDLFDQVDKFYFNGTARYALTLKTNQAMEEEFGFFPGLAWMSLYHQQAMDFLQDSHYFHPLVKMLNERRENSRKPFYFYSFGYQGTFNMGDWVAPGFPTIHGQELLYLFKHDTYKFPSTPPRGLPEEDRRIVNAMVESWTSFAIKGVPQSNFIESWPPYGSRGDYLRLQSASSNANPVNQNFHSDGMSFWANISESTCG